MKEDSTVSCYDRHAKDYDLYQSAVVPGYQEMLDLVAEACRRYLPQEAKIIDLGCGTGNAALAVLQKIPSARIYLIDGSERMVKVAAEKISCAYPDAILGCRVADLAGSDWDEGLESDGYDAIISTLVLEHLPFDRYKAAIAKCLPSAQAGRLAPGGGGLRRRGKRHAGVVL